MPKLLPRPPIIRPTGDPKLDTFQQETRDAVRRLEDNNALDFVDLEAVVIGTAATLVSHRLGRRVVGWHLTDIRGDARVWRDTTSTADPEQFLVLKASAAVTINLRIF